MHPACPFTLKQIENFFTHTTEGTGDCIHWVGCAAGDYGRVSLNGVAWTTHRVAYVIQNGPIPEGLVVRHKCDNPICVNHLHLELGTQKDNARDMVERGRANGPKGERAGNHVLTREQVSEIKTHLINGTMNQLELCRHYKCARNTIHAIRMGISWANVEPILPLIIPQPHRKLVDQDYIDIRQKWKEGWKLKQIAEFYSCRVDTIQAIIKGKRGVSVPTMPVESRQNAPKHSPEVLRTICQRYWQGESQAKLRKEFGYSKNGIYLMIQRYNQQNAMAI